MQRSGRVALLLTCAAAVACSDADRDDSPLGGGDDSETSGTEGNDGDDGGDDGGSDDGGGDDGLKYDVDDGSGGPGDGYGGCEKIDFLFVIDNSGSMWDNQQNLANSFPGFISTIRDTLNAQDYHILVTDSDPWTPTSTLTNLDTSCEVYPYCCYEFCGPSSTCSSFTGDTSYGSCPTAPPPPTQCDATLGAGRNLDWELNKCSIVGDRRFMVDGQPDLDATFDCVARAGIGGDWNEQPVNAAVAALQPDINASGGCNEGFLRDDAILVVTIISDANTASGHLDMDVPVSQWHDALVAAKGGNAEAIVVLGLFQDGHLPGGLCSHGNPHYQDFVDTFVDRGFFGSACAADYSPIFLEAVSTIDTTCEDFDPPG